MKKTVPESKSTREKRKIPGGEEMDRFQQVIGLRSGCKMAWGKVFSTHRARILSQLAKCGAQGPDLQEFYYEAFEAFLELVTKQNFAWENLPDHKIPNLLGVIAYRKYIGWRRRNSKWPIYSLDQMMEDFGIEPRWESELEMIEEREENLAVASEALSNLPKDKRKIIELRIYHGLSFREVALEMGYFNSEGEPNDAIARVYYRRALQSLRKIVRISTSA